MPLNTLHLFKTPNIKACYDYVLETQKNLDGMVESNDINGIHRLFDLLTRRSEAVKILAVNKVTRINTGKHTAGTDGVKTPRGKEGDNFRLNLLSEIDISQKPNPIRRVMIPKRNGGQRPLGIPTISDRIVQEIIRIGLEPIVEYHFDDNSYGFRPKRSCQDAMVHLHKKLARKNAFRYVIEGDIKGCFDNISHDHILNELSNWHTPNWCIEIIAKILKSGIFIDGEIKDNETGTPQGGVISPLLANVALTTLDKHCHNFTGGKAYNPNPIVRYADDFIIVCKSEQEAMERKQSITEHLANKTDLNLSDEKSKITHIYNGFDFLGFNFRKYRPTEKYEDLKNNPLGEHKLLIRPKKENVLDVLYKIKLILKECRHETADVLIRRLNPILMGWCMYYRFCSSKQTFSKVDYQLILKLIRWTRKKHPQRKRKWIVHKYFIRKADRRSLTFSDRETGTNLFSLTSIPIVRFIKVRANYRVYENSEKSIVYWQKRDYVNSLIRITSEGFSRLYRQQKGLCSYCKGHISADEITDRKLHTHHVIPLAEGGSNKLNNLRLMHAECHKEMHALVSRQEMRKDNKEYLDMLNL